MKDLFFFGLNTLLLLAAWKWALRPAILRYSRDKLFDGRQRWREEFLARRGTIEDPLYHNVRDVYNHFIRFLELNSIPRQVSFNVALAMKPKVEKYLRTNLQERFFHEDEWIAAKAKEHRRWMALWAKFYLIHSSIIALTSFYTLLITFKLSKIANKGLRKAYREFLDTSFDDSKIEGACELVEQHDGGMCVA
jgi:hypothetical protein